MSVSPNSGSPGALVTASGEGYQPGEQVNVIYKTGLTNPSSVSICTTTAAADGTFSCTGDIPTADAGATGNHKIKAKGTTSHATANTTFTLT